MESRTCHHCGQTKHLLWALISAVPLHQIDVCFLFFVKTLLNTGRKGEKAFYNRTKDKSCKGGNDERLEKKLEENNSSWWWITA